MEREKKISRLLLALCALLITLAPSDDSLWIDEAGTAQLAMTPTFREFVVGMTTGGNSEQQMPLSMLIAWVSAHILGTSEYQLRLPNLLWGFAGLWAFYLIARRLNNPWVIPCFAVQPYLWFYVNEFRPYAFQIGLGAWLCYSLLRLLQDQRPGFAIALICITSFLLCASSLLGVIPAFVGCAIAAVILLRRGESPGRRTLVCIGLFIAALVPLGLFYIWTLARGAGGARFWNPSVMNVLFSLYELAGYSGLGPPRDSLRELGRHPQELFRALLSTALPLATLVTCHFLAAVAAWSAPIAPSKRAFQSLSLLYLTGTILLLSGLSALFAWPFWGRHLAPVFPFFCVALALCFETATRWRQVLGVALISCSLASTANVRFNPLHRKDDYRNAAHIAKQAVASGGSVWWVAAPLGASYYGLTIPQYAGRVLMMAATVPEKIASVGGEDPPSLIILSKPDVSDAFGAVQSYLSANSYRLVRVLPGFKIYAAANYPSSTETRSLNSGVLVHESS
jgi:hypothetical protein